MEKLLIRQNPYYWKTKRQAGKEAVYVLVPAAGTGSRMGSGQNKLFYQLGGLPVIAHTLKALQAVAAVDAIIVLAAAKELDQMQELLFSPAFPRLMALTSGGSSRQASVARGLASLAKLASPAAGSPVLIHDGARCLVSPAVIERVIEGILLHKACGAAVPVKDTIKVADSSGQVLATPERSSLMAMQTPQGALWQLLDQAYRAAGASGLSATDDLAVLEAAGQNVFLVPGDYKNVKLTTPEDLLLVKSLLAASGGH